MTTAAILIIGDEVLSGKVEETNSVFLVRALRERGVQLREIRIIPDVTETIVASVGELSAASDHLITTGGIGPTHDDKTIEAVAKAFGRNVVHAPELIERLESRYGSDLNDARLKLAEVPDGATVRTCPDNPITVIQFENLFILPGVPSLMRLCFERIADDLGGSPIYSKAIFLDVSESEAAAPVAAVQGRHVDVAIGSYPRFDKAPYRVKITVDGQDLDAVHAALEDLRAALDPAWLVDVDGE
jgi:molybdenum cofactor synthesis domain-containing protein